MSGNGQITGYFIGPEGYGKHRRDWDSCRSFATTCLTHLLRVTEQARAVTGREADRSRWARSLNVPITEPVMPIPQPTGTTDSGEADASNAALPPAAAVLMVTTRSTVNRRK